MKFLKMFTNERLEKIEKRLSELHSKREELQNEINEINNAIEETFENYALGEIDEKDVKAVEKLKADKEAELQRINELIAKVSEVKKPLVTESIPLVKQWREKQIEKIQKEYDQQVKKVYEARYKFLEELAKLGQIPNKVGGINKEYRQALAELGVEEPRKYLGGIDEIPIISGGYTSENKALGVSEQDQKAVYYNGKVLKMYEVEGDN